MVEVKKVSKRYGNKAVVDNVSVKIAKGKITSFIGPNGAGKSTLLSMVSRLLTKDSGEVYIDGREIGQWRTGDLAKKNFDSEANEPYQPPFNRTGAG